MKVTPKEFTEILEESCIRIMKELSIEEIDHSEELCLKVIEVCKGENNLMRLSVALAFAHASMRLGLFIEKEVENARNRQKLN